MADDFEKIVLTDEDGKEYDMVILDYFFYNGDEYATIADSPDADEVLFMKVTPLEGDDIDLDPVDEDLAEQLLEVYNNQETDDDEDDE